MSLEDLEVNVGGTKFKGVYLAILLSFGSTLGGGIWAASEFFSRLETLEGNVETSTASTSALEQRFDDYKETINEDINDFEVSLGKAVQELEDNDVAGLQGRLATLGTNLNTIMDRQQELINMGERIVEVEKKITETEALITKAELMLKDADLIQAKLDRIQKEIDDIWEGMDYLANPYGG